MRSYDFSVSSASWVLVYDSAELGDFYGYAQVTNSADIMLRIGTELPAASDSGALLRGFPRLVTVKASAYENIYARARGNRGMLSLMAVSDMQLPSSLGQKTAAGSLSTVPASDAVYIVAGQSAVGLAPANPPVGVSGIDGSGLKRSLLTDSIGQMMTTEQDSAVFNASATSAGVLFTVDMTNWRSVLLQITSAGTSCTVIYECSNDQSTWNPITGLVSNATPSAGILIGSSNTAMSYTFGKRAKYFRARVSVYGSGTVSGLYSLTAQEIIPAVAAYVWGQGSEASAVGGNPITIGVECRTSNKTSVGNGQIVRPIGTVDGKLIVRQHSIPENEWAYAAASGGLVNINAPLSVKSGAGAGLRNYVTSIQFQAEPVTNPTEFEVRDGSGGTVLWRIKIPAGGIPLGSHRFDDPLRTTQNTALYIVTTTASGAGAVYFNAQGYVAP